MCKIAVVDDNEAWCLAVKSFFSLYGFEVSTFTSPHRFLDYAEQFDLVLVDFSMPCRPYEKPMDGADLIAAIKENLSNPPLLVLISAYFTEDVLDKIEEVYPKADAYLIKDSDFSKIMSYIKQLIKTRYR